MMNKSSKLEKNDDLHQQVVAFVLTRKNEELAHLDAVGIGHLLGVNGHSLSREFAARQGITLNRFIMRERIYRAFFEIERNRDSSGTDLWRRLGFHEPAHFNREFKNIFLIEPDRLIRLRRLPRSRTCEIEAADEQAG